MSASRQISVRLAVEGAEAARRQLEELRKTGEATGEGLAPKPQQIAAWERLNRAVDPNIAAAARYEQVVRRVQAAEAAGIGTTEQRNRVMEQAALAHQRATSALDQQASSSGRFGQAMGQAGFQVQDFATQVAMGQNALLAFGVQFAQFAGIFGTAGAIAGAAVTLGVLGAQFLGAGAAADTLGDAVKAVNDNYTRMNESAERRLAIAQNETLAINSLSVEYAALSAASQRAEGIILDRQQNTLRREELTLREQATSFREMVRPTAPVMDPLGNFTGAMQDLPAPDLASLVVLRRALEDYDNQTRLTVEGQRNLATALHGAAQAGGENASALLRQRDVVLDGLPAIARLEEAQKQVATQTILLMHAQNAGQEQIDNYILRLGSLGMAALEAAAGISALRRINSESPFADIDQEAARTEAQLAALRRGGLDALQATQDRQAVERAGAEANARVFAQEMAALRERGVAQEAAEAQAAAAAVAAQARAEQGVQAAQALAREQRAAEQAARDAERAAAAAARAGNRAAAQAQRAADRAPAVAYEYSDTPGLTVFPVAAVEAANRRIEEEQRRSLERQEREAEQSARDISRFLADGFTDAFVDGERGFAGMLDSFRRLAIATPIRIATEAAITPLVQSANGAINGAGGLSELFGLAQAGRQFASLTGFGGGNFGGVTGFLQTPLFTPAFGGGEALTLGGAFGGIGGGFALGNLLGGLTAGDSRARQQNSQIGSGLGAVAGTIIGGPLGGLIGGAAGGGLGGLIGPGRAFSGGDALIGINDNGGLNVVGFAGKNFDQSEKLLAEAQQQVAALNALLSQAGLTLAAGASPAGGFAAAIGGGESGNPRNLIEALTGAGVSNLRAADPRVQEALNRLYAGGGAGLETQIAAATEAAQFAAQIDAIAQAAKDAEDPIGAIRRSYEEQFRIAERLGFGYDVLAAAQQKAIDAVEKQKRAEEEATRAREEAARQREAEQQAELRRRETTSIAAASRGILEDLTVGGVGGLSQSAQATAARLQLQSALGALSDGATAAEAEDLRRVAGQALPLIQRVEGITGGFASLVQQVADAARAISPGADGANLGGVIDATVSIGDQISDAVTFAGGATVQALRELQAEQARVAAVLSALMARQAA